MFPKSARRHPTHERVGQVVNGVRLWNNEPAAYAFFAALGSNWNHFTGCNVCHTYRLSPYDPQHFTRLSNLTAVSHSLWRFTDFAPVEAALQRRAFELYRYKGTSGNVPPRPLFYPDDWSGPLSPDDPARTVRALKRLRAEHPGFWQYTPRRLPPSARFAPSVAPASPLRWLSAEEREGLSGPAPLSVLPGARNLEAEFWREAHRFGRTTAFLVGLVVRHAYFAPPRVVALVANPFPLARRVLPYSNEKPRQVVDGVTLTTNMAAADALTAALGRAIHSVRGGNVDHVWVGAPVLPAHFCHLGGLVLVPFAFASLVDAPPIRGLLARHLYERTGYAGPSRKAPPPSRLVPRDWPETVNLTRAQEDAAIAKLMRMRATRPGYYPAKPSARPRGRP